MSNTETRIVDTDSFHQVYINGKHICCIGKNTLKIRPAIGITARFIWSDKIEINTKYHAIEVTQNL